MRFGKGRIKLPQQFGCRRLLRHYRIIGTDTCEHFAKPDDCARVAQRLVFLQTHHLRPRKAVIFGQEGQKQRWNWPDMRWVEVEVSGCYYDVFRVWSFKDEQAARFENPIGLNNDRNQLVLGYMLNHMKCCDDGLTIVC